jgi:hypothetical protein
MMLTSVKGHTGLPRYFAQVFDVAQSLENGRLYLVLDDGSAFRAEGRYPGPVTGPMVCAILAAIQRLRAPPSCA